MIVWVTQLILKLTNNLDWSWFWVLAPTWICIIMWLLETLFIYFMDHF